MGLGVVEYFNSNKSTNLTTNIQIFICELVKRFVDLRDFFLAFFMFLG